MEKSVSQILWIVDMFLAQENQKQSISFVQTSSLPMVKKVEIKFELQIQITHNSRELLYFKTPQVEKYGQELSFKSRYFCRY